MTESKKQKDINPTSQLTDFSANIFLLEQVFPTPDTLFFPSVVGLASDKNTLVAIDTNALLLPYSIGKDDLSALAEVYKKLEAQGRLFLPARSAREFINHRDKKIAEIIKTLNDQNSKIISPEKKISSLLEGVAGYDKLSEAADKLKDARSQYAKAREQIIKTMMSWRGNDPVTAVYDSVFKNRILEHGEDQETIKAEWQHRLENKIPPGYKDASKEDTGIGDFLIWKTILRIGKEHKKDLIFVTGEEKADWFVRSDTRPIYPRPELVDEYRRASGGKNLRLSTLHELLAEMNAPNEVVKEVLQAEAQANNAIRSLKAATAAFELGMPSLYTYKQVVFDYSTNDGIITVVDGALSMDLKFSKGSDARIHLSRTGATTRIARAKNAAPLSIIFFDQLDSSSRTYTIAIGEVFLGQNERGETLVGRITGITDDSRGADADSVSFKYAISASSHFLTCP